MSTIKSLPSESKFNSIMEGKSASLGFYQQKYGQQNSVKKTAQEIIQKKLAQVSSNNKKLKKPVEELPLPVMLNLPMQIQHFHTSEKVAFLSLGSGVNEKNHSVNHSLSAQAETSLEQRVNDGDISQTNVSTNLGTISTAPSFRTKMMEQKVARFLSDNPMSAKQTQWMSIPLAQQTEVVEMATLKSSLHDEQSNLLEEASSSPESATQTQNATEGHAPLTNHEGRPAPNERPEVSHLPDMKNFNIEKSEVIHSDEMDITKSILEHVRTDINLKQQAAVPQASTTQEVYSVASKVAELMAAASEAENPKATPSRTLSYTFNQWQNAPTVSFTLANAHKEQIVASTQSPDVQHALQDNQHLWTGEQKMVIRREEHEGQHRQQQQQHQQDEES